MYNKIIFDWYLNDKECPDCGGKGNFEWDKENEDLYKCMICGYAGSLEEDEDMQNYLWDEGLSEYSEEEKGEVFDCAS